MFDIECPVCGKGRGAVYRPLQYGEAANYVILTHRDPSSPHGSPCWGSGARVRITTE